MYMELISLPSPSQMNNSWLLLFLLFIATCFPSSSQTNISISYAKHCSSIVPESIPTGLFKSRSQTFYISNGYITGGDNILSPHPLPSGSSLPGNFYFYADRAYRTRAQGTIKLHGSLEVGRRGTPYRTSMYRRQRHNISRSSIRRKTVVFELSGFWSESTGKLCMVGTGTYLPYSEQDTGKSRIQYPAVFKLNYPQTANISTSLAAGTVESIDSVHSASYFDPISLLVYAQNNYSYTKLPQVRESCAHVNVPKESLGFESISSCSNLKYFMRTRFRLEYGSDCSNKNCGPFLNKIFKFSWSFFRLNQIQCLADGKVHMSIRFSNASTYDRYDNIFAPDDEYLVAEGLWDKEKKSVCLVACPLLNTKGSLVNASVGKCTIGFIFWFPAVLSIKNRSTIVGRIWSDKDKNDPDNLSMISFKSSERNIDTLPGMRYEYSELDVLKKSSCVNGGEGFSLGTKRYPDVNLFNDMRFDITLRDKEGTEMWGYATPVSLGETLYSDPYATSFVSSSLPTVSVSSSLPEIEINQTTWNVSYKISCNAINSSSEVSDSLDISAEGVYNAATGMLCMVGCRYPSSSSVFTEKAKAKEDSIDCKVLINIQLSSVNPEESEHLNGTISSARNNSDHLYFEPLTVSSNKMYQAQAIESIWRMDIEITMVMVSLALLCIFTGFQLLHVKKQPDALPSLSILMLVILTMGHMIPLVLNFEALFFINRNRQNVLLWSGGWLEVNEVIVRVTTMVAFLLQFRLLHLSWTSRSSNEGIKNLWVAERKSLRFCLPLYFGGALIAWFVHSRSYEAQQQNPDYNAEQRHSLWEDLLSYAGLILDGFLLPQIVLNALRNSKDKALAPLFYIGTTIVRALPHLYDAYRARHYLPHFNSSFIYASPDGDFYSSAWDIAIPLEGGLFAVLIYLQQRFGGSCFLPQRFKKHGGYETIPAVSS